MARADFQLSIPGVFLAEILAEFRLSQADLAHAIDVSPMRVSHVVNGGRPVTAELALRLGKALGESPEYWLNLQSAYRPGDRPQGRGPIAQACRDAGADLTKKTRSARPRRTRRRAPKKRRKRYCAGIKILALLDQTMIDIVNDPFYSAKRRLTRARKHASDLEATCVGYHQ